MIPQYAELLRHEEVERIHEASLQVLEEVGLEVYNAKALDRFKRHGCRVDTEASRVRFPRAVVEEFIKAFPEKFTFYARDPEYDRTLPDDGPIFLTTSSGPKIIDPDTGEERWARSEDIARIAHLVNELSDIDVFSVSTLADDGPDEYQTGVTRFYTAMKNCVKPVRGSGPPKDAESILQLCYLIAGSEEAYREHPFFMHHHCPVISPLKLDEDSTELLMFYAEQGLPSYPTIVPNAGLTSPLTMPGTLAQANAEFLASAVLMQMSRQGTPLVYSSLPTVGDMRSGAYAPGGIECGMLNMASAQLARFYGLPHSCYTATNAKVCDVQAGFEKGLSPMAGLLAGADIIQMAGLMDALMAFDYSMVVVDNEIARNLKRVRRGVEFSEENLSLDEIKEVGPGGMFIGTDNTLELMSSAAIFPDLANRDPRQIWLDNGAPATADLALERAREILSVENPVVFSPEVDARIREQFKGMVAGDSTPLPG